MVAGMIPGTVRRGTGVGTWDGTTHGTHGAGARHGHGVGARRGAAVLHGAGDPDGEPVGIPDMDLRGATTTGRSIIPAYPEHTVRRTEPEWPASALQPVAVPEPSVPVHQAHVPATWVDPAIWAQAPTAVPAHRHRPHTAEAHQAQTAVPSTPTAAVTAHTTTQAANRDQTIHGTAAQAAVHHLAAAGVPVVAAHALPTGQAAVSAVEAEAVAEVVADADVVNSKDIHTRRPEYPLCGL